MLKKYSTFLDIVDKIIKILLILSVAVMVFAMVYQVILRYIFNNANSWSEELTRYIFIYQVMLASAVAVRRNSHLQVDVLIGKMSTKVKSIFTILSTVAGIIFLIILFKYSLQFVNIGARNISSGLNIPMSIPYTALPVGCILMILTSIEVIAKNIVILKDGGISEK